LTVSLTQTKTLTKVPGTGQIDIRTHQAGLYRCGKAINSKKAGQYCQTHLDCPASISGLFASCGCTYGDTQMRCDILPSNSEYQDYITATIAFQAATAHCHNARILESGPCDKLPQFRDM